MREFVCYFEESDGTRSPIQQSMDAGLMVYDLFEPDDVEVTKKDEDQNVPVPRGQRRTA